MTRMKPTIIELNMDDLEELLQRVETRQLKDGDCETIKTVFFSYVNLTDTLKDKNVSMRRLRKMLFGLTTEKTASVVGSAADSPAPSPLDENAPT